MHDGRAGGQAGRRRHDAVFGDFAIAPKIHHPSASVLYVCVNDTPQGVNCLRIRTYLSLLKSKRTSLLHGSFTGIGERVPLLSTDDGKSNPVSKAVLVSKYQKMYSTLFLKNTGHAMSSQNTRKCTGCSYMNTTTCVKLIK